MFAEEAARNASEKRAAVRYLSAGFLAIARAITASIEAGAVGRKARNGGGGSIR